MGEQGAGQPASVAAFGREPPAVVFTARATVQYADVVAWVSTLFVSALAAATPSVECPAPAEVATALNTLIPGVVPEAQPGAPLAIAGGLRLGVLSSPEGDVRVDLLDAQGEVVLHRVLPGPPRGRAPDCPALAETVALIVDRYLHDVGYEVPPLPAPPPPAPASPPPVEPASPVAAAVVAAPPAPVRHAVWRVGLAGSGRLGDAGGLDGDGDLALAVESGHVGRAFGARLSVGYAPQADARWIDKAATLRRLPFRLGLYLSLPAGLGRFEPGLGGGADLLLVSVSGAGGEGGAHWAPFGDLSAAYTIPLTGTLYGRLLSRAALSVPYDFDALGGAVVWGTPRVYGEVGVELGFAFL